MVLAMFYATSSWDSLGEVVCAWLVILCLLGAQECFVNGSAGDEQDMWVSIVWRADED